jgi:hypothetical protein
MSGMIHVIVPCLCNKVSLYKHGTKTQNTLDIPQASLHKHRIAQITSDIPETSLHKHGTIT